jgi:hypothetical protein
VSRAERNKAARAGRCPRALKDLARRWVIVGDGPFRQCWSTRIAGTACGAGCSWRTPPGRVAARVMGGVALRTPDTEAARLSRSKRCLTGDPLSRRRRRSVRQGPSRRTGWLKAARDAPALRVLRTHRRRRFATIGAAGGRWSSGASNCSADRMLAVFGAHRKGTRVTDRSWTGSGGRPFVAARWRDGRGVPAARGTSEGIPCGRHRRARDGDAVVRILKSAASTPLLHHRPTSTCRSVRPS